MKIICLQDENDNRKHFDVSEIKAQRLNQWKGWRCSVGINSIHIDFDGGVWVGTCRVGGSLGNIFDGWTAPTEWTTCTKSQCNCGTEIKLPKFKPGYESLLSNGTDEAGTIDTEAIVSAAFIQDMIIHVQWDLGRFCNYDCSYCPKGPKGVHNDTESHKPFDVLVRVVDQLHEHAKGKPLRFCFAGGEVTLHPQFLDLCKYIKSLGHLTHLTTNGSRGTKYWSTLIPWIDAISISIHFEFAKMPLMLKNIQTMIEHRLTTNPAFSVEVKLMTQPHDWDMAMQMRDAILALHQDYTELAVLQIAPLRVSLGKSQLMDYTPEQIASFGNVRS